MLKLFNGQYKNEKTLIKFNMVRYTTMCIVLDYYCFMNSLDSDVACTIDHLIGLVFNKSSFKDTKITLIFTKIAPACWLATKGTQELSSLRK